MAKLDGGGGRRKGGVEVEVEGEAVQEGEVGGSYVLGGTGSVCPSLRPNAGSLEGLDQKMTELAVLARLERRGKVK